jgi:hypothetical protein
MSVLKNGELQLLNPWDEELLCEIFGDDANRVLAEVLENAKQAKPLDIPPMKLIETIREYENQLGLPSPALRHCSSDFKIPASVAYLNYRVATGG